MEKNEKNQLMFIQLVSMFQAAALQQMGKLKNPATDKIEKELEQAQFSIDLIDMLKEKTTGNLSPEEEKILTSILQDLKLNYVDEMAKGTAAPAVEKAPE
jgi:PIN domain nuclease of toxin-antitoxin system